MHVRAQQRPQGNHECGTSHVVKYHEHAPETPRARPVRLRSRALFGSFGKSLWGSFVNADKVPSTPFAWVSFRESCVAVYVWCVS